MEFSLLIGKATALMGWLAAISLLTFITSLLLIPLIVRKLPADVFIRLYSRPRQPPALSPGRIVLLVCRNAIAVLLLVSGFIMLFIPGQGLLTMLIGLLLLTFPGKQKLVLQLIRRQPIQKSLDWIRIKQHCQPFDWPG